MKAMPINASTGSTGPVLPGQDPPLGLYFWQMAVLPVWINRCVHAACGGHFFLKSEVPVSLFDDDRCPKSERYEGFGCLSARQAPEYRFAPAHPRPAAFETNLQSSYASAVSKFALARLLTIRWIARPCGKSERRLQLADTQGNRVRGVAISTLVFAMSTPTFAMSTLVFATATRSVYTQKS
jgi:hypothetical protein